MNDGQNSNELGDLISDFDEVTIREQSEEGRRELPDDFFDYADSAERAILAGKPVPQYRAKSVDSQDSLGKQTRDAVLQELRLFLCTKSKKYADVRRQGQVLTNTAIGALALGISATVGIAAAAASAAAGFGILLVGKVGVNAFCRLVPTDD